MADRDPFDFEPETPVAATARRSNGPKAARTTRR